MKQFKIKTNKGIELAEGFTFKHHISNYQYSFGYQTLTRIITSLDSGYKVGIVPIDLISAHNGNTKSSANM